MDTTIPRTAQTSMSKRWRSLPPGAGGWLVGFAPVTYLALSGGGFDSVVRGQAGLAMWWIVLVGVACGAITGRLGRSGWAATGGLAALAAWTALSATWSESAERSVDLLGQVALYVAILVLALEACRRVPARHLVEGVAAATGLVGTLAVLSRLHPAWFPADDLVRFFPDDPVRLSYPLNYWNGLATFVAIGIPGLLMLGAAGRRTWVASLAVGLLPVAALCIYYTGSRGGVVATVLAALALVVLAPDRLPKLAALTAAGLGSAVLLVAAGRRPELADGLSSATASDQGDAMLAIALVVCVGVGLLQAAITTAARHLERPAWATSPPRLSRGVLLAALVLVLASGVAGGFGAVADTWETFKLHPDAAEISSRDGVFERLGSGAGNGRYQYWSEAVDANATDPLRGIGAGTYGLWWARNPQTDEIVRHAHSWYLQTLAELGIVGLALVLGLAGALLAIGLARLWGSARPEQRLVLAAAVAGVLTFLVGAAFDWVWDLPAVAAAFLVLGAVGLSGRERSPALLGSSIATPPPATGAPSGALRPRLVLGTLAVAGIAAVSLPLAGTASVRDSQEAARNRHFGEALADARSAARIQPYAATPRLQQALLLEVAGDAPAAARAAALATAKEPTNWRLWVVRSRVQAATGDVEGAIDSYRRARRLNPRSDLFRAP